MSASTLRKDANVLFPDPTNDNIYTESQIDPSFEAIQGATLTLGRHTGHCPYAETGVLFSVVPDTILSNYISDPWFLVTVSTTITIASKYTITTNRIFYCPNESAASMGCTVTQQYCNPSLPGDEGCTPDGSPTSIEDLKCT